MLPELLFAPVVAPPILVVMLRVLLKAPAPSEGRMWAGRVERDCGGGAIL